MMRDDGTWKNRCLKAFTEIANSEKLLATIWFHDSHGAVPVIHSLWIALYPCGQAVPESRFESLAAGTQLSGTICPLIYPPPANTVGR